MAPAPPSERLRLAAVPWLWAARLCLWLLPLRWTRGLFERAARGTSRAPSQSPRAIGAAVRAAVRAVPRATCLAQALAAGVMLRRAGLPAVLHLGVRPPRGGALAAHAWVTSEREMVVGGEAGLDGQVLLVRLDLSQTPALAGAQEA